VAQMEMVLDVYKRPYNPNNPVICMDESPKQLIGEKALPIQASPGQPAKYDYAYIRNGVCNIFMACEPLSGKRIVKITERKTKKDWSYFLEDIAEHYEDVRNEAEAWQNFRNNKNAKVNWQFRTEDARIKLSRLYPTHDS